MVKIMIPMAKPSILTVIMFNFLTFWNEYIIAYTLMDENGTLAMGLKNLMAVERTATNYGIMYAGLVIVMIPRAEKGCGLIRRSTVDIQCRRITIPCWQS